MNLKRFFDVLMGVVHTKGLTIGFTKSIIWTGCKTMPPKYRHFSEKEAEGIEPDVMAMLDVAAERAGVPFIITCKGRTVEHNKEVGGVPDSAHVDDDGNGLTPAVDLACDDSTTRWKMVFALKEAGFKRIIIEPRCVHVDNDPGKPEYVLGVYVAKQEN